MTWWIRAGRSRSPPGNSGGEGARACGPSRLPTQARDERTRLAQHTGDSPVDGPPDGPWRARRISPLQPREYKRLAQWLHSNGLQPASLLESHGALIGECGAVVEPGRLQALLDRGFRMAQALDRWQARSIWVVSRGDDMYPEALRSRLKGNAPPLLYGCGPMSLLGGKGFAVVGPRDAGDALLRYAEDAAELAARAAFTVVSGGAKGVDRAAMNGALGGGGRVAGVLPGGLERAVVNREHRGLLLDQRLVLVSLSDPRAGFQVGHAMARNKLITRSRVPHSWWTRPRAREGPGLEPRSNSEGTRAASL